MSSRAEDDRDEPADVGLLDPVTVGTAGESLTSDRALVAAMIQAEAALVRALVETGVAPASAAAAADTVDSCRIDVRALALAAGEGGNPVVPLVPQLRAAVAERDAAWVHHGTTSQDVLDTALMLLAAATARQLEADLGRLAATLATLVDATRAVPAVARTLNQQALPTTLGMRAAGWLAGVHDAVRAVRRCTTLPVSLGGPVGTASAYGAAGPDVVETFARFLDQRAPVASWHTRRTPVLTLTAALLLTGEACGKIAADVLVTSQTEIGETREGRGGTSSSMAHKANPVQSVLVASAARRLPGLASTIAGSAAAEQERPAGAWHAEWEPLRAMLRLAAAAAERTADLVADLQLDQHAMRRNLDRLVAAVGEDEEWVAAHVAHVDVWIDRVLAQHEEVFA